jgi:type IV pilus assembly protein PilA
VKKINLKKGFTLIELMIVVAIIGILAAIAIPNFIRYQLRSKSAEAKTVMGGIKTSQESFRGEYDAYVLQAPNPGLADRGFKTSWIVNPCPNTCNRLSISAAPAGSAGKCDSTECIGYRPSGDVYYEYVIDIRDPLAGVVPEFVVCATADLDGDAISGGFQYGTGNDPANTGFVTLVTSGGCAGLGAGVCGGGGAITPASEVVDCDPQNF